MMKCHFALLVLLHLGATADCTEDQNLIDEIIGRLERLNQLHVDKKLHFTSTSRMMLPTRDTLQNVSSCVNDVIRKLKHSLQNVTLHTEDDFLDQLEKNLNALMSLHPPVDRECTFAAYNRHSKPFKPFITVLKTLNGLD